MSMNLSGEERFLIAGTYQQASKPSNNPLKTASRSTPQVQTNQAWAKHPFHCSGGCGDLLDLGAQILVNSLDSGAGVGTAGVGTGAGFLAKNKSQFAAKPGSRNSDNGQPDGYMPILPAAYYSYRQPLIVPR